MDRDLNSGIVPCGGQSLLITIEKETLYGRENHKYDSHRYRRVEFHDH